MSILLTAALIACPTPGSLPLPSAAADVATRTYRVRQTVVLSDVPTGARQVAWWIALPGDERAQEVLDMQVTSAPGRWTITRDPDRGNRFLYVEVADPKAAQLEVVAEFTLRREPVVVDIDPAKVGRLTDEQRRLYAEELRTDAPHMQVTPAVRKMAQEACGDETNLALQSLALLEAVADYADHYSKDPSKPKCGVGDAGDCLTNRGGCCTDLHSLFIALARSRGIPARLQMGYRLLAKNEGKEVDPGYRCWPEFFVPGYGWVPADVVEADAASADERSLWLSGLTERRLWLNEGREFVLPPRASGPRVNTMVIGYAEIDGKPARVLPEGDLAAQLSRRVHFVELPASQSAALSARGE